MAGKVMRVVAAILREGFWLIVAIAIVAGGVMGFRHLAENREVIEPKPVERPVTLVETQPLVPAQGALPIRGEGFIKAFRQVSISGQEGGRVVAIHPALIQRGTFTKGEVLVQLDDRTQHAALDQAKAAVEATEVRLAQLVEDRDRLTKLLDRQVVSQTNVDDLDAEIKELEASLRGEVAARQTAAILLEDRQILAPFDGAVLSRSLEIGDVVMQGQPLAVVFTAHELEVDVPMRQADARLIPDLFTGGKAAAVISVPFAGEVFTWSGHIDRIEPQLDRTTRTLTVAVRLDERLSQPEAAIPASGAPPALINAFARVVIEGVDAGHLYEVPSTALTGDQIWLNVEDALQSVTVRRVHIDGESTFVAIDGDLPPNPSLVVSPLSAPRDGLPLRDARTGAEDAS